MHALTHIVCAHEHPSAFGASRHCEHRLEIYVGNLPWSISDEGLSALFAPFGTVDRAKVMVDRETGRSRGFGFVTMNNAQEANAAINALNGQQSAGRALRVNEAQERQPRTGGGGGGGGFGGGGDSGRSGGGGGGRREGGFGGGGGGGDRDRRY